MQRPSHRVISFLLVLFSLSAFTALAADDSTPAPLTFEQRVSCVEKVEDVYWAHRIWPESNPGLKPPRASIVSRQQVADSVERTLLYEAALLEVWGEVVTPEHIQSELDRIGGSTLHPDLLRDVFLTLDNDPYLVAECFVRPRLVERRLQGRFDSDPEIHSEIRLAADSIVRSGASAAELETHGATVSEMVWRVDEPGIPETSFAGTSSHELVVSTSEIADLTERLESHFGDLPSLVDTGFSQPAEIGDGFVSIALSQANHRCVKAISATWQKRDFHVWFDELRSRLSTTEPLPADYTLPLTKTKTKTKSQCVDNTWVPTSTTGAPANHSSNVTVWTGAEMIVWGGGDFPGINTGGRYDLTADSWTATSTSGAPSPRRQLDGVWTGTEMVVWGGVHYPNYYNTGGRYNPATNSWSATTTTGAPSARSDHSAVWTGTEMIVWGGNDSSTHLNTGGRYNPASNTWTATSTTDAPSGRRHHTAVWTGTEMIIWAGNFGVKYNDGARYSPATNSWTPTSMTDVPSARDTHTAVWTGSEMIVWGGYSASSLENTGGRYEPSTDTWIATSTSGAPAGRYYHTTVWTGTEMIVWGGNDFVTARVDTGGRYDPAGDTWTATSTSDAPVGREHHSTAWAGPTPLMIVWGGWDDSGPLTTGGLYCVSGVVPYDFGDAPDPSYPTLEASDGARHRLGGTLYLGSDVDSEDDGLPTANADGDDNDNRDDEDGVTFTTVANPGGTAGVDVEVSETGLLNAWVDFNADGDWDDAGEQIFTDEALAAGANPLVFSVPATAVVGTAFARFRVDSAGGLLPTGAASDGEVEDHPISIQELDFGDAPDPTYPTLLASNGARHVIDGVTYLGAAVDADPDGQPDANANGDDNDAQGDDEDGVTSMNTPVAGRLWTTRITASTAGVVNAWIDYNSDGDWADAGEQIFTDVPVVAGQNFVDVTIPITATTGVQTFGRYRFSTVGGLSFDGPAPDGEVEDKQLTLTAYDYGDAPDPSYPTLDASDGARHRVEGGLYLGALVDHEADGQPTAGADGDDLDGGDDEDGVAFTSGLGRGLTASLDVTATGAGLLSAWIDFNADGDWDDAGEQVFTDHALVTGVNHLSSAVPPGAALGLTYARFRFSTSAGLSPTGDASDGEVEDYAVEIVEGPDLSIEMAASGDPAPSGRPLTYTITVTNNGPLSATSVTVTDTLPGELVFVSSTPGASDCTYTTGTLTCDLGSLAPSGTSQITIETVLDHPIHGGFSNTSTVTANELDPITANNTATVDTTIALFGDGFESGDLSGWD